MAQNFEGFIAQERTKLSDVRESITTQIQELHTKLADIDRELEAIAAYEAVKTGKATGTAPISKPRAIRTSGKRTQLLDLIKTVPTGLTRGELLEKLNLKGDKKGEQSVSNALTNLKKQGQLTSGDDGRYHAAPA